MAIDFSSSQCKEHGTNVVCPWQKTIYNTFWIHHQQGNQFNNNNELLCWKVKVTIKMYIYVWLFVSWINRYIWNWLVCNGSDILTVFINIIANHQMGHRTNIHTVSFLWPISMQDSFVGAISTGHSSIGLWWMHAITNVHCTLHTATMENGSYSTLSVW